MTTHAEPTRRPGVLVPLLRASHFGPTVAVTTIATLLGLAVGLATHEVVVLAAAVLAGQLTIGWGNDLRDARRDREVGRTDKPLANGELTAPFVLRCVVVAAVACLVLSLTLGWDSGVTHLVLGVGAGHLYNLVLKPTAWSWVPYAVAFGSLPVVVHLAGSTPQRTPAWMICAAASLGVAAHFLNTLPDLDDDAATGVRGLPHRLGATRSRVLATALLVLASAVVVLGPAGAPATWAWVTLGVVVALAVVALVGRGKAPFHAALAIALVDVLLLAVVAG